MCCPPPLLAALGTTNRHEESRALQLLESLDALEALGGAIQWAALNYASASAGPSDEAASSGSKRTSSGALFPAVASSSSHDRPPRLSAMSSPHLGPPRGLVRCADALTLLVPQSLQWVKDVVFAKAAPARGMAAPGSRVATLKSLSSFSKMQSPADPLLKKGPRKLEPSRGTRGSLGRRGSLPVGFDKEDLDLLLTWDNNDEELYWVTLRACRLRSMSCIFLGPLRASCGEDALASWNLPVAGMCRLATSFTFAPDQFSAFLVPRPPPCSLPSPRGAASGPSPSGLGPSSTAGVGSGSSGKPGPSMVSSSSTRTLNRSGSARMRGSDGGSFNAEGEGEFPLSRFPDKPYWPVASPLLVSMLLSVFGGAQHALGPRGNAIQLFRWALRAHACVVAWCRLLAFRSAVASVPYYLLSLLLPKPSARVHRL